jgi:cytochrome c-type protein NapC
MIGRLWRWFWSPSTGWALGTLLIVGGLGGILFWGGFNWSMELTNNEKFCITCHEMRDTVFQEYRQTVHYSNRSGVRASCPDCHVPKEWIHKVVRKVQATNELYHTFITRSIDTLEKFEAKRIELAENVWYAMKTTDSRECRNCHAFDFMDLTKQEQRSVEQHQNAEEAGKTCIDCHRGIAHELPQDGFDVDLDELVAERNGGAEAATR